MDGLGFLNEGRDHGTTNSNTLREDTDNDLVLPVRLGELNSPVLDVTSEVVRAQVHSST